MNTDQKAEKGNVARIVDRLSKDFGGSVGNAGSGTGKTENVPMRNRVVGVGPIGANIGWVDPTVQSAITKDAAAIVRFSYSAQQPDELDLKEGDELLVLDMVEDGWAKGEILNSPSHPGRKGRIGLYPTNFVSTISPTPITQTPPINSVVSSSGSTSTFPRTIDTNQNQENIVGIPLSKSVPKSSNLQSTNQQQNIPEQRTPLSNQNKPKELAKVLYKYDSANIDELSLPEGAVVTVISRQCEDEGWFLAEIDGRRGLFPDNFVKFIPDEAIPTLQSASSGSQAPPPLLPTKPQKFVGTLSMNPPPVASIRDSLSALNHSSANSPDAPTTPENQLNLMSMSMTTAVASDIENNNGVVGNSSSNASNKLSAGGLNSAGNRKSINIQALQKAIFPTGQIPMQPPKKPPNNISATSIPVIQLNEEPKMKDFNSISTESATKLLDKSIIKSRTKVAPNNKRPPSKVNSAAILVDNINNNDNKPPKILGNSSSITIPTNNSTHTNSNSHQLSPSSPIPTTTPLTPDKPALNIPCEGNKSTTSFSSQPPLPSPSAHPHQPLHCSIEEEHHHHPSTGNISNTHPSQQHKSTPFFQPLFYATSTTTTTASFHPKTPPSPSNSSIASGKTDQTFEGGSISTGLPPSSASSSQWVGRAEFDRLAEDYQRKFAEMRDELKELRGRVDLALNK